MSRLQIFPDNDPSHAETDTRDGVAIALALKSIDVRFERWQANVQLGHDADDAAVIEAYAADVERLKREKSYKSIDVIRMLPDNPKKEELRKKYLDEHIHDDDEVRFFVEGAGVFYLHAKGKIYMVLCERGDLMSVPAGVRHWFDMGPLPHVTAIRLFENPDGWVAKFTGDDIATQFPKFESASHGAA